MSLVFADAGYWIALWDRRDSLHERARRVSVRRSADSLVTTWLVLVETLDHFADRGPAVRLMVARNVRELNAAAWLEIVQPSQSLLTAALERYAARADQRWSLTDCASFLIMEERGIAEALAYDRDFEQAGFAALLRGG